MMRLFATFFSFALVLGITSAALSQTAAPMNEPYKAEKTGTSAFSSSKSGSAAETGTVQTIVGQAPRPNAPVTNPIKAMEKISVFPVLYEGERGERVDEATAKGFDEAWWQVREELTNTGRLMVASRAHLQKADAFQPRGGLSAADAVILGRYVEADGVMTISLRGRSLTIQVWDVNDTSLAWTQTVELHPSVLIREQIAKISRALAREFIASMPYQGVTIQDTLARQAVVEDEGRKIVRVKIGKAPSVGKGELIQWVQMNRTTIDPLYQGGSKAIVKAEGTVVSIQDQVLLVELTRVADSTAVRTGTLVQIPKEAERLIQWAKPRGATNNQAMVTAVATGAVEGGAAVEPEGLQMEREKDRKKPVVTTLSILGSLAVLLLLAF